MTTYLIAFIAFIIIFLGMAVGVIFSNKPIKGSCGGLNKVGITGDCEICGGNLDKCEENNSEPDSAKVRALTYEASRGN